MKYDMTIQGINTMHQHMINVYKMLEQAVVELQTIEDPREKEFVSDYINQARSELLDAERVLEQAMLNYDFLNGADMWS